MLYYGKSSNSKNVWFITIGILIRDLNFKMLFAMNVMRKSDPISFSKNSLFDDREYI